MTETPDSTDGYALPVERRTYLTAIAAGTAISGGAAGAAAASSDDNDSAVAPENIGDPDELAGTAVGYGRGGYGEGRYGDTGPPPLPGFDDENLPTAQGEDGLFDDLNGDEEVTVEDVQLLFDNLDDDELQAYAPFYNFSGTDPTNVSIFDVQALFNRSQEN